MNALGMISALAGAIGAGYDMMEGEQLVLEDLSCTMESKTYRTDNPQRIIEGELRPILAVVRGKTVTYHEFVFTDNGWVEVPGRNRWVRLYDTAPFSVTLDKKRLSRHQVQRANKELRRLGISANAVRRPPMRHDMTLAEMRACIEVWDQTIGCSNCGMGWWGVEGCHGPHYDHDDATSFHADGCQLLFNKLAHIIEGDT
jgi:hypothetical protein